MYLKEMRLTIFQKSRILTGAFGSYTVDALSRAALHIYPSIKDAFKSTRDPRHSSYPTGRTPKRFPRRTFGKGKKSWRTNEAHQDEEEEDNDEYEDAEEDWP